MKAYLMHRDNNPRYGVVEWWKTEDGDIICVDFNASIPKTMAFLYDMERNRMIAWEPLGVWHRDMTGGKAMQDLGYRPVEDGDA